MQQWVNQSMMRAHKRNLLNFQIYDLPRQQPDISLPKIISTSLTTDKILMRDRIASMMERRKDFQLDRLYQDSEVLVLLLTDQIA